MKLEPPSLYQLDHVWEHVKSGNLQNIAISKKHPITADDIKTMREYHAFMKTIVPVQSVSYFKVITKRDVDVMVSFYEKLGIEHEVRGHYLSVLYMDDRGYGSRQDRIQWLIIETFTCETCGKQTGVFEKKCGECATQQDLIAFDPGI